MLDHPTSSGKNPITSQEISTEFLRCLDLHQTLEYANAMKALGWKAEGSPGSFIYARVFGPTQLMKIQRPLEVDWDLVKQIQKRKLTLLTHFDPSIHQTEYPQGFSNTSTHVAHTATAVFDLTQSLDDLKNEFSEETKRNIQKGLKNGEKILITPFSKLTNAQVTEMLLLQQEWKQSRSFRDTHSMQFQQAMFDQHAKHESGWLVSAHIQNKLSAFIWYLETKDLSIYFIACSSAEANKRKIPSALIWKSIELGMNHKKKFYDFYGMYDHRSPTTYPHWKGFSEFKSRFHPEFIEYPLPLRRYFWNV